LDLANLAKEPKWIVGSSDLTALLIKLWAEYRLVAIHGPLIATFEQGNLSDYEALLDLIQGKPWRSPQDILPLFEGSAKGPLIGGNLTILAHLCGAVPASFARGAVLFLEDVAEQPYRLDRSLTQLLRAGFMDQVAGLVLGRFTDCPAGPDGMTAHQVIAERLEPLGIPVAFNYPAAHGGMNYPFLHGAAVRLDVSSNAVNLKII
jgi:muramoyltetrapeptide carboxypeptidase